MTSRGAPSQKCQSCLERQREVEANRPERDRTEYSQMYESLPVRKDMKKEWNEANPEKMQISTKRYRSRRMTEDPEVYRKVCAENQRAWRDRNPKKWEKIQEKSHLKTRTIPGLLKTYKQSAKTKDIEWELTDEQAEQKFQSNCFYCGELAGEHYNGIDRLDSDGPYSDENTRACCSLCNFAKGTFSPQRFIAQCARICCVADDECKQNEQILLLFQNIPYESESGSSFQGYRARAMSKQIQFTLEAEEFDEITQQRCYLCENMPEGRCGVDRVDNNVGYILENCQPCCATL